jgi:phosphoribosyl-AMP cyclohydrolase / phosphoribosyl-ATP pyrophosphohydrolase
VIIPSIDLMSAHAVQLVGGREHALDAGDPFPIAERFRLVGEIAVIDLDAALGKGSNAETIERLCQVAPCRVGGGIRSYDAAVRWLDAGARKIILGTAATPDLLKRLPRERVIAALDARHGKIVTHGWQTDTTDTIDARMVELRPYVSGFLVTFVETEGRMQGIDLERVRALAALAGDARLTAAGGVTTPADVAAIDAAGADAQVGMALYTGRFDLADATAACLRSDRPDGLFPTVVCDEHGVALGLAYSNLESLRAAIAQRRGVYHSRTRGLWIKGETSGQTQELLKVDLDCDRDTLRFTVRQSGPGFCHNATWTCWGNSAGLPHLARTLAQRARAAAPGSYTARLFADPALLRSKLLEEAGELADARDPDHVAHETADLIYFALAAAARAGVSLELVERELERRSLTITRRPGDAKPATESPR